MVKWTAKTFSLKEKTSKQTMLYSLIIFAISLIIFNATSNPMWTGLSGFFMIISGAVVVLFILIYFILKVMEGLKNRKEPNRVQVIKKASKKSITKKRTPAKKKVVSKKKPVTKKKTTKKKTTSKKRK